MPPLQHLRYYIAKRGNVLAPRGAGYSQPQQGIPDGARRKAWQSRIKYLHPRHRPVRLHDIRGSPVAARPAARRYLEIRFRLQGYCRRSTDQSNAHGANARQFFELRIFGDGARICKFAGYMSIGLNLGFIEHMEFTVCITENVPRPTNDVRQAFTAIGPENIETRSAPDGIRPVRRRLH